MSIRKNILSALLFTLALTLISFGTSVYYLNKIGTISTNIVHENYLSVKVAEDVIVSLAKVDRALVMLCLDQELEHEETVLLKVINSERKILSDCIKKLESSLAAQADQSLFDKLSESHQQYDHNLDRVATTEDRKNLYSGVLRWQSEVLRFSSTKVMERHYEILDQSDKELERIYLKAKINIFLATIFVLVIAAAAFDKLPAWVIRPIVELTDRVKAATQSDSQTPEPIIQVHPTSELAGLAEAIKTTHQRLKDTEEKFWLITDNLYDIIFFCTPERNIFYTTPSIRPVLGFTPEEVVGKHPWDFLHPENIDQLHLFEELIHQEKSAEIRLKRKNGEYLWVEMSSISHRNDQGETAYVQYTARDISERKRNEKKLKEAFFKEKRLNEQLTKTNLELDHLVYSASHNLRAPLTSVLGLTSLLKEAAHEREHSEFIGMIEASIYALDETVEEIINYSRNERDAITIEKIDFEEIIVEAMRNWQFLQSSEHPVTINYHIDPAVRCFSDAQRLKTIFISLGANAIKYCNPTQPESMLQISVAASQKETLITFEDNGIGIHPESQRRVFDMFYRGCNQTTGAGLGLYIVKSAVTQLNGDVSLTSVPEEGTRITINLPSLDEVESRLLPSNQLQAHS